MDNYTKGKWVISQHHLGTFIVTENKDGVRTTIATIEQAYPKGIGQLANAKLILTAVNACIKLNPDNPLAVAESISDLHEALKALSLVTRRVSYTQNELAHANEALAKADGK